MSVSTATRKASAKQIAFIASLRADRGLDVLPFAGDSIQASREIDRLKALPRSTAPLNPAESVTEGMYERNGEIFKVQRAVHGSGNLYAKKLTQGRDAFDDEWTFEYAPGAIRRLRARDKMTIERAKEFGALYGVCCVCAATLTNEESIAAGIGPVCSARF